MKFKLTTDKGSFISIPESDLNKINIMTHITNTLVNNLISSGIDNYNDEIKKLTLLLHQMFNGNMPINNISKNNSE